MSEMHFLHSAQRWNQPHHWVKIVQLNWMPFSNTTQATKEAEKKRQRITEYHTLNPHACNGYVFLLYLGLHALVVDYKNS